jgi:hypothetical protein
VTVRKNLDRGGDADNPRFCVAMTHRAKEEENTDGYECIV